MSSNSDTEADIRRERRKVNKRKKILEMFMDKVCTRHNMALLSRLLTIVMEKLIFLIRLIPV